jgi:hypothetical protein
LADPIDRTKSLEELEHDDWGLATYPSYLVKTCHKLHRKPLNQFTVEDLRIMIGQRLGLEFLIPIALDHLEHDPLVEGDFYPGDLLKMTLDAGEEFWARHPEYHEHIRKIIHSVQELLPTLDEIDRSTTLAALAAVPQCLAP